MGGCMIGCNMCVVVSGGALNGSNPKLSHYFEKVSNAYD
jgi:hypothetical protein